VAARAVCLRAEFGGRRTRLRYLPNVVTLTLDAEKCTGCGLCVDVCPHGVLAMGDHQAAIVDRDACMECGACVRNCAFQALSVRAGVGCAAAVLNGMIRGGGPPCDCCAESACSD